MQNLLDAIQKLPSSVYYLTLLIGVAAKSWQYWNERKLLILRIKKLEMEIAHIEDATAHRPGAEAVSTVGAPVQIESDYEKHDGARELEEILGPEDVEQLGPSDLEGAIELQVEVRTNESRGAETDATPERGQPVGAGLLDSIQQWLERPKNLRFRRLARSAVSWSRGTLEIGGFFAFMASVHWFSEGDGPWLEAGGIAVVSFLVALGPGKVQDRFNLLYNRGW